MRNGAVRLVWVALLYLVFALSVRAQISVSGNLKDLGVSNATGAGTYVLFTLRNYGSNIAKVSGTNVIVSPISPPFKPDASGVISGTIQPTDTISPNGTYYQVCIYYQGQAQWCQNYVINSTPNPWNLNSAAPMTTSPIAPAQVLGARTFVFSQGTAATTWTVVHNFNDRNVLVECFSLAGVLLTPSTLTVTDPNTVTVTFGSAQTGTCVVQDASQQTLTTAVSSAVVTNPTANQVIAGYSLSAPSLTLTASPLGIASGGCGATTAVGCLANLNGAGKPATADALQFVTAGGSDSNDGESWGTAKLTPGAAVTAIGASQGIIHFGSGTYVIGANLTVPSNVTLDLSGGAILSPSSTFTLTINGAILAPPRQIFSGAGTTALGALASSAVNALWFSGTDIGAQVNNAYAAITAVGGVIFLPGNPAGGCYSFSTPISGTAVNKVVSLRGFGTGPVCLTYTGTGNAITWAWGGQHFPDAAIANVRMTGPGSGGTTVGIMLGTGTGFNDQMTIDNDYISGFGTGLATASGNVFDITLKNSALISNGNGFSPAQGTGTLYMVASNISTNTNCGILMATGNGTLAIFGGDIESNGTSATTGSICLTGTQIDLSTYGVHFENTVPGSEGPFIYSSGARNNINIHGLEMLLDAQTVTVPELINFAGGDTLNVDGVSIELGAGVTLTQAILSQSPTCTIFTRFRLAQVPGSIVGGAGTGPCFNIINEDSAAQGSGSSQPMKFTGYSLNFKEQGGPTNVGMVGFDSIYGDSSHCLAVNNNNGGNQCITATIASGTAPMTTAAIAAGACGTTVTVAAAGAATTDSIAWSFNAAPAGTNAGVVAWPTAGNVNFAYCPGVAETPAAATINWRVMR